MPMVDVNTVWLDDFLELIDERLSRSLNTQHCINFDHIVTICLFAVNFKVRQTFPQVGTVSLENDVLKIFFAFLVNLVFDSWCIYCALGCLDGLDVLNAADEDVAQVLLYLEKVSVVFVLS